MASWGVGVEGNVAVRLTHRVRRRTAHAPHEHLLLRGIVVPYHARRPHVHPMHERVGRIVEREALVVFDQAGRAGVVVAGAHADAGHGIVQRPRQLLRQHRKPVRSEGTKMS